MSDAAVFLARKRKRADLAEQWLDALPQVTQVPWLRIRAEAGILEAEEMSKERLGSWMKSKSKF